MGRRVGFGGDGCGCAGSCEPVGRRGRRRWVGGVVGFLDWGGVGGEGGVSGEVVVVVGFGVTVAVVGGCGVLGVGGGGGGFVWAGGVGGDGDSAAAAASVVVAGVRGVAIAVFPVGADVGSLDGGAVARLTSAAPCAAETALPVPSAAFARAAAKLFAPYARILVIVSI